LGFWEDHPTILAGRDMEASGTWMGVTQNGYFAVLTNYRDPGNIKPNAPSRGKLVSDYLIGEFNPPTYLQALFASAVNYNSYNIILGTLEDPWYFTNEDDRITRLGSGIYGLSNAFLDTKWPKVEKGKAAFKEIINNKIISKDDLFDMMLDKTPADDHQLPNTGVGYDLEKKLSAMFVEMKNYGTRNTTLLLKHKNGDIEMIERTHSFNNKSGSEKRFVLSPRS
jgi:uncharacterized protein with NRDE domain